MMFSKHKGQIAGLLVAAALAFMAPATVFADGTTTINLSQNSTEVGKDVTVTVSGTDSSTLSLRFNNEVFEYVSCTNSGATVNGNVVTFTGNSGSVTFKAIGSGSGDLIVSSDTLSGSSVSVPVTGQAAPQEASETEEEEASETEEDASEESASEETSEEASEPEEAAPEEASEESEDEEDAPVKSNASTGDGDFVLGGQEYVLSERFSDSEIPQGFKRKTLHIHGGEYDELSNGSLTLVYLKPADNIEGSGEFYIYDEEMDHVSKYAALGSPDYYVTVEKPKELVSDILEKTKISVGGETFRVYQIGDGMTDFYYVYGVDQNGNKGWYSYDSAKETIQRANEDLIKMASAPPEQEDETQGHISMKKSRAESTSSGGLEFFGSSRTIIAISVFVMVVLLVILLDVLLFRRRGDGEDMYDFPEDEDDGDKGRDEAPVPTVEKILEEKDFDEANKPHRSRKIFKKEKSSDIWDTGDKMLSDTSKLAEMDDASKLKKQVFRGRSADGSGEAEDSKIDVIDFNDL